MSGRATNPLKTEGMSFVIAGWRVDPSSMRISNEERSVRLEPMAMAVFELLARDPGKVVSRQELEATVWAGRVVGHDAVSNAIIKLRKALGDKARNPHIIETIPKTGYRLIAEVSFEEKQAGESVVKPGSRGWLRAVAAVLAGFVLAIGAVFWWQPWIDEIEPASVERMAFPLPDKPSVAILPFVNLSEDAGQEYFSDGMTDDLITDLSKVSGLFVIARNSVFTYKGHAVKVQEVAEELGIRYVIEGSVRRVDDQVRVNAHLIDAISGVHIWAQRYDGPVGDVFSIQDRITQAIVSEIAFTLAGDGGEQGGLALTETSNPEAYEFFLRGWSRFRLGSRGDLTRALAHFQRAIGLDPDYSRAHAALAATYWNITRNGWWGDIDLSPAMAMEETRLILRKAMERPIPLAHQVASERAAYLLRKPDNALAEAQRAIALDSNDPAGHLAMSTALLKAGKASEAVESVRRAMRFDPHYPASYLTRLGEAQFALGQYGDAAATLEAAARRNPDDDWTFVYLVASYGHLGREQEAKQALERANSLRAQAGWGALTVLTTQDRYFKWAGDAKTLREGLRKAGVDVGAQWLELITGIQDREVTGATTINLETARSMHKRGVAFIDVSFIWFEKRIPGAYYLSGWTGEFNEVRLARMVDKTREIVIYHGGGGSPRRTFKPIAQAVIWGFEKVHYFPQGLHQWEAAGYPVESAN